MPVRCCQPHLQQPMGLPGEEANSGFRVRPRAQQSGTPLETLNHDEHRCLQCTSPVAIFCMAKILSGFSTGHVFTPVSLAHSFPDAILESAIPWRYLMSNSSCCSSPATNLFIAGPMVTWNYLLWNFFFFFFSLLHKCPPLLCYLSIYAAPFWA